MLVYSLQTTFKFSQDEWRPECIVCFFTSPDDALLIPRFTRLNVIFLFCEVPFNEENGNFTTEAINVVLDYAIELREKVSNEVFWLTTDDKCSRIGFKKSGERSLESYDFFLNIWRKKDSHMSTPSLEVDYVALKNCLILKFPKKAELHRKRLDIFS